MMEIEYISYVFFMMITVSLYFLSVYWLRSRLEGAASKYFFALQITISFWMLISLIRVIIPFQYQHLIIGTKHAIVAFVNPLWILFTLQYTGRFKIARKIKKPILLFGVIASVLHITNINNIMWAVGGISNGFFPHVYVNYSSTFLVWAGISYSMNGTGIFLLLEYALKSSRITKNQLLLLASAPLPAVFLSVTRTYGLFTFPGYKLDFSSIALSLFVITVFYVLLYQGFLSYVPFARDIILREISKPILIIDDKQRIADYNEELVSLYPEVKGEFGKNLSEIAPELTKEEDIELLESGEKKIYSVSQSKIMVEGETSGETIILDDVTEIRKKTEQLKRQTEQLEEFTSVVSHDLRNPISIAKGYAEMVENTGETDEIDTVVESIERADNLIENSLKLARKGKAVEEKKEINMAELAEKAWETSETKDAKLELDFSKGTKIMADGERLRTLFENLFRNSVDHGPNDVKVRVSIDTENNSWFVEDNGPGIPEDEREEVLDFGYTTSEDGSGFGLATVNKIAQAHGWELSIESSSMNEGARFEFRDAVFN